MTTGKLLRFMILMLCVLAMSACAVQPVSDDAGFTGQSTGDTAKNTDIVFDWNVKLVRASASDYDFYNGPDILRLTYDSCKELLDNTLLKHGICREKEGGCWYPIDEDTGVCPEFQRLKDISYPEEYFTDNSLLLIPLAISLGEPFAVKDVVYEAGVLTCTMECFDTFEPHLSLGANDEWFVFIEVDTVLPQETQLKKERTVVKLEWEEFEEKRKTFDDLYS